MSGIQTFKYKRQKITVIFWNTKVWFYAREICQIVKCSKKDDMHRLFCILAEYMPEEDKLRKLRIRLFSASGLQYLVKRVTMKPQRKEKLKEFCEWVEQEVMPVFDEYLRSWL